MNVLLLTDKLTTGGAEMYFCKLENSLSHTDLRFFTAASKGELFANLTYKDKFSEISRKNHLFNVLNVYKIIKKNQIKLVHANSLRMVLYCVLIKKFSTIRFNIIYTKHNVTVLELKNPKFFSWVINKYTDRIITVSEFEKVNLINLGVEKKKIKTIYNGVDLKQFQFHTKNEKETFKVGILARLSEEKNHKLFVKVASEFVEQPNVTFYIAGDGPESKSIQKLIKELNIEKKVKLLGAVANPENFIKEMDILLMTSHREVFPMTVIESMAVGTPIISINRGGIKEAIENGQTGILIEDHSVYDFYEKINYLRRNPEIKNQMVNRARKKAENDFSLSKMVEGTMEEYLKHV